MRDPLPVWRGWVMSLAALRPRETPAAWAASRARIASGSRTLCTGAGADSPPGMSRLPGRRIGRPLSVRRVGGVASTRLAASQPASTSESAHGRSPVSALSQFDRSDRKIGVSSSSIEVTGWRRRQVQRAVEGAARVASRCGLGCGVPARPSSGDPGGRRQARRTRPRGRARALLPGRSATTSWLSTRSQCPAPRCRCGLPRPGRAAGPPGWFRCRCRCPGCAPPPAARRARSRQRERRHGASCSSSSSLVLGLGRPRPCPAVGLVGVVCSSSASWVSAPRLPSHRRRPRRLGLDVVTLDVSPRPRLDSLDALGRRRHVLVGGVVGPSALVTLVDRTEGDRGPLPVLGYDGVDDIVALGDRGSRQLGQRLVRLDPVEEAAAHRHRGALLPAPLAPGRRCGRP